MILARNNIVVPIKNAAEPEYAILNPVSGSFDMMDASDRALLDDIESGKDVDPSFSDYLLERGYAYRSAEDEISRGRGLRRVSKEIGKQQVQLLLSPLRLQFGFTYCNRTASSRVRPSQKKLSTPFSIT
jgi:hypothetical protein